MDKNQFIHLIETERAKNKVELEIDKLKTISEIRKVNKSDMFKTPIKLTLWQKIKVILGF